MLKYALIFAVTVGAHATTVYPEFHECPVCDTKSVTTRLGSYSQFGESARDLSDSPPFMFADVEICPGNLFASWSDAWNDVDANEKTKLKAFLEEPQLHLTDAERAVVAGHEEEFRESVWFKPLWVRTCDELRSANERRSFNAIMRLHFAGSYLGTESVAKDWEKQLVTTFREGAIKALKDATSASWPKPDEKRIFTYLRGELTRQAGRDEEALTIFQEVITAEKTAKPGQKYEWISRWAAEQSLRCGPEAKDAKKLIAAIIPELPDPWRVEGAADDPRWSRHSVAVDLLASGAAGGDKVFSEALWKLLDRNPMRLLALLETAGSNIKPLKFVDPRWSGWFAEIYATIQSGKVPNILSKDPNDKRVINVLLRTVGTGNDELKVWRKDVLLPAVRKAALDGGIPEIAIPRDDSFFGLDTEDAVKAKPSLNDLSRALYALWEEQPPDVRPDIARVYIRILHKFPDEYEATDYPASYFLPAIAETKEGRAAIISELAGKWKGSFWKLACSYAARLPNSAAPFLRHPLTSKADSLLIVALLRQQSDAGWKDQAMKQLNDEWISSDVIAYLDSLNLPDTRAALDQFAEKVRNEDSGAGNSRMDGGVSALQDVEDLKIKRGMAELPIR